MNKGTLKLRANYHWTKHLLAKERGDEEEAKKQFAYFEQFSKELDVLKKINN